MNIKHLLLSALAFTAFCAQTLAADIYTIYPIPQIQKELAGRVSFTEKVNIVADPTIDQITINRAIEILEAKGLKTVVSAKADAKLSNLYLGVNGSKGIADKKASQLKINRKALSKANKYDRHALLLTGKNNRAEAIILGENTDATFCGLATLEQMLDNGTSNLRCVSIEDWADIRYRGVIEGYYGVPYNADVTKDLFHFMARYKMNTYMYGAKSDPYHSQKWSEAYPDSITPAQQAIGMLSQSMMKDIVEVSHAKKVNFIWAIHPGHAFCNTEDPGVIDRIMQKFQIMYDLGVRQFGVFVDDIGGYEDEKIPAITADRLSQVQSAVENRWNKKFSAPADTVKPINFVPQLYAYNWVKPDVRKKYFNALGKTHPQVVIYITGANIWSVPNSKDLDVVSEELGRRVAWWWNYPCNDNDMTKLFVTDTYNNFADEKWIDGKATLPTELSQTSALISNPMQQGAASKIALFGVGDYSWNNSAFNNEEDFKAAARAVVGREKAECFRYLTQYLRYYDNEPILSIVENYKRDKKTAPVRAEMMKLLQSCQQMEQLADSGCKSDSIFVADIRPWLNKLSDMSYLALQLLDAIEGKVNEPALKAKLLERAANLDKSNRFHFDVLNGMGDEIELSTRSAEPAAVILRPFIDYLAEQVK